MTLKQKCRFYSAALIVSVLLHVLALTMLTSFGVDDTFAGGESALKVSFRYEDTLVGSTDIHVNSIEQPVTPAPEHVPQEQKLTEAVKHENQQTKPEKISDITPAKQPEVPPVILAKTKVVDSQHALTADSEVINGSNDEGSTEIAQTPVDTYKTTSAARQLPKFVLGSARNPKPEYPMSARRRGWQGNVMLGVTVGDDGVSENVTVLNSSGYPVLDQAALTTIRDRWVFTLAYTQTAVEPRYVTVPISFRFD